MGAYDDVDPARDCLLSLDLDVPRALVWRCWTEPALLRQWFTPAPWMTPVFEADVRPGGLQRLTMASPEGERHSYEGVYLDVVPGERLVVQGYGAGLSGMMSTPFMLSVLTFADTADGGTHYEAKVRHFCAADRDRHAEMGFEPGWTAAARQLETLAKTLPVPA